MAIPHRTRILAALLTAVSSFQISAEGEYFLDLGVDLLSSDNVSRAMNSVDLEEDVSFGFSAKGDYYIQAGDFTSVSLLGNLQRTLYESYDGLNNNNLGVGLSVSHKFGIGGEVPSIDFIIGVDGNSFDDDVRDALVYTSSVTLSRRFGETLLAGIGVSYEERDGDHDEIAVDDGPAPGPYLGPGPSPGPDSSPAPKPGDSFSVHSATLFAFADLDIGEFSWLSFGYQYSDGEVTSTSTPTDLIVDAATAITNDSVFGSNKFAYRLDAKTHTYNLDWNRAILETATLIIGVEYQDTNGYGGIDYNSTIIRAVFIYGF
jgi:hypothetical protein